MIPKIIHYCWFGRNPLPESAIKCINSWKKFFPDYEIKEWNEDNFDVNMIPYTKEAYEAKKYAFVSDFARFWILYRYGGIYFDTDVEVIRPFNDIIERGPFMGIEVDATHNHNQLVAPGLGLGATSGLSIYKKILDYYQQLHFRFADGSLNVNFTVVNHTSNVLYSSGMARSNELQDIAGIWIYPKDYFNPFDDNTGDLRITENTRSIHWYASTWESKRNPVAKWIVRKIHKHFGVDSLKWLNSLLGR